MYGYFKAKILEGKKKVYNSWTKFGHSDHSAADCAGQKMCLRFFFPGFANRPANSLTLAIELPGRMVVFVFEKNIP